MTRRECNGTRFLGDHVGPGAASWTIQCREAGFVHGGSWAEIGNNIRSFEVCKTTWSKWLLDATCGVHGALSEVIPHEPIYLFSFECTGLKDNNLMRAAYICILWQTRDPQSHRYQNPRRPQRSKGIPSGKNTRHSLQPPIHLCPLSIAVCRKLVSSICEDPLGGWSWDSPNLLPSAPQKVTGAPRSGHGHWESHQVQTLTHWLGKSFRPFAFAARNGCAHTTKKMLCAFHGKRPRSGQTKLRQVAVIRSFRA